MDLLWTKVWPKSLAALWSVLPAAQSCGAAQPLTFCIFFCWQHDNRKAEMSVDWSNANRRKEFKKKNNLSLQSSPKHHPALLPEQGILWKAYSQQVSADTNETCKITQNAPLSSVCWQRIKSENADTLKNNKKNPDSWWQDQVEFLLYWFGGSHVGCAA